MIINNYILEIIGTYLYVFINLYSKNAIITGISLAIIIIIGHLLSYNGYFNPSVTLSMYLDNILSFFELLIHISVQFLAGYLAYLTNKILK